MSHKTTKGVLWVLSLLTILFLLFTNYFYSSMMSQTANSRLYIVFLGVFLLIAVVMPFVTKDKEPLLVHLFQDINTFVSSILPFAFYTALTVYFCTSLSKYWENSSVVGNLEFPLLVGATSITLYEALATLTNCDYRKKQIIMEARARRIAVDKMIAEAKKDTEGETLYNHIKDYGLSLSDVDIYEFSEVLGSTRAARLLKDPQQIMDCPNLPDEQKHAYIARRNQESLAEQQRQEELRKQWEEDEKRRLREKAARMDAFWADVRHRKLRISRKESDILCEYYNSIDQITDDARGAMINEGVSEDRANEIVKDIMVRRAGEKGEHEVDYILSWWLRDAKDYRAVDKDCESKWFPDTIVLAVDGDDKQEAEIDHLLVGPMGAIQVETKYYSSNVNLVVKENRTIEMVDAEGNHVKNLDVMNQIYRHGVTLSNILPKGTRIFNIICSSNTEVDVINEHEYADTFVTTANGLPDVLNRIYKSNEALYDTELLLQCVNDAKIDYINGVRQKHIPNH